MAQSEAFLDSTAIAARILADRRAFPLLMTKLQSYSKRSTSQYVLMEIRRGFIKYLVFLYNCALGASNYSEVFNRIERLLSTPRTHLPRTMLQNLRVFFEEIEETKLKDIVAQDRDVKMGDYMLKATISSLRMRIRNCWNDLHSFLDAVVNQLNCYPDLQGPKQIGNRFDARLSFCETLHVACNLSSFLAERRNELQQVLGLISGAPADEETKRRIAAIGSALEDFSALEDPSRERREVCWDLGDLLVCLEAPEGADILNDNARHMDPICTGLGKNSVHWR